MTTAIDDLTDDEIREIAVKLRRRRIGNRLPLALVKWIRNARRLELWRFRAKWARKFNEYECVGGPLDGAIRPCNPCSVYFSIGGHYKIDRGDMRLHFVDDHNIPSWKKGL